MKAGISLMQGTSSNREHWMNDSEQGKRLMLTSIAGSTGTLNIIYQFGGKNSKNSESVILISDGGFTPNITYRIEKYLADRERKRLERQYVENYLDMSEKKNTRTIAIGAGGPTLGILPLQSSGRTSLTDGKEGSAIDVIPDSREKTRNSLIKGRKSAIVRLTIYQICKQHPDTLSKCFWINEDNSVLFFAIGEPSTLSEEGFVSQVEVLQLDLTSGELAVITLGIKVDTIINAITTGEWWDKAIERYEKVKEAFQKTENRQNQKLLKLYHHWGIKNYGSKRHRR